MFQENVFRRPPFTAFFAFDDSANLVFITVPSGFVMRIRQSIFYSYRFVFLRACSLCFEKKSCPSGCSMRQRNETVHSAISISSQSIESASLTIDSAGETVPELSSSMSMNSLKTSSTFAFSFWSFTRSSCISLIRA